MPHADEHENESENVTESVNVSESESVNESETVTESATVTETGRHGAAAHALGLALVRPHEEDDEAHARGHAALRLHDETRGDRGQNRAQGRRRAAAAGGTRTRKRISTGTRKRTMNQVRDDRKRMHSRSVTNFLLLLSLDFSSNSHTQTTATEDFDVCTVCGVCSCSMLVYRYTNFEMFKNKAYDP